MGRSLGASVATYLASQVAVRQLILVTPFASLHQLVHEKFVWLPTHLMLKNSFDSDQFARSVTAPVHIIMAENDEIIPAQHPLALQAAFIRTRAHLSRLERLATILWMSIPLILIRSGVCFKSTSGNSLFALRFCVLNRSFMPPKLPHAAFASRLWLLGFDFLT